jgi:hypothetical protein
LSYINNDESKIEEAVGHPVFSENQPGAGRGSEDTERVDYPSSLQSSHHFQEVITSSRRVATHASTMKQEQLILYIEKSLGEIDREIILKYMNKHRFHQNIQLN